jgi:hypothetical protein
MYLEDPGFRYAGRVLKICHGIVYQWIRKYEKKKELPQKKEPVKIVELDEIHIYVCQKKTAGGYGLQLTDMENGVSLLSVGPDQ